MLYRLKTIFNEKDKEVFDKVRNNKEYLFILESLNNNVSFVTKEEVIKKKKKIVNVSVSSNGRLYVKNCLENKVFSWWKYYGNSSIVGKQVIGRMLDEEGQMNLYNLKKKGIDGIIIKNAPVGMQNIQFLSEEYVAFYPNQIKSVYNRKPKLDNQIFEEKEIKKVQSLSKEQIEFFRKTTIKDRNGLKLCFHSTNNSFNEFNLDLVGTGHGASYGEGFYFSSEPILEYGNIIEVYLNIERPYIIRNINDFYEVVEFLKKCGIN